MRLRPAPGRAALALALLASSATPAFAQTAERPATPDRTQQAAPAPALDDDADRIVILRPDRVDADEPRGPLIIESPIVATPTRDGLLLNPRPAERDGVRSLTRYDYDSSFYWSGNRDLAGAPPGSINQLIYVQPSENIPPIAISPFQSIDEDTRERLLRTRPWLRRTDKIVNELRQAQSQWLREQGLAYTPRTVVNTDARLQAEAERRGRDMQRRSQAAERSRQRAFDRDPGVIVIGGSDDRNAFLDATRRVLRERTNMVIRSADAEPGADGNAERRDAADREPSRRVDTRVIDVREGATDNANTPAGSADQPPAVEPSAAAASSSPQ